MFTTSERTRSAHDQPVQAIGAWRQTSMFSQTITRVVALLLVWLFVVGGMAIVG